MVDPLVVAVAATGSKTIDFQLLISGNARSTLCLAAERRSDPLAPVASRRLLNSSARVTDKGRPRAPKPELVGW